MKNSRKIDKAEDCASERSIDKRASKNKRHQHLVMRIKKSNFQHEKLVRHPKKRLQCENIFAIGQILKMDLQNLGLKIKE